MRSYKVSKLRNMFSPCSNFCDTASRTAALRVACATLLFCFVATWTRLIWSWSWRQSVLIRGRASRGRARQLLVYASVLAAPKDGDVARVPVAVGPVGPRSLARCAASAVLRAKSFAGNDFCHACKADHDAMRKDAADNEWLNKFEEAKKNPVIMRKMLSYYRHKCASRGRGRPRPAYNVGRLEEYTKGQMSPRMAQSMS